MIEFFQFLTRWQVSLVCRWMSFVELVRFQFFFSRIPFTWALYLLYTWNCLPTIPGNFLSCASKTLLFCLHFIRLEGDRFQFNSKQMFDSHFDLCSSESRFWHNDWIEMSTMAISAFLISWDDDWDQYQPCSNRGTRSLPERPHRLQNSKWPLGGSKMAVVVCVERGFL